MKRLRISAIPIVSFLLTLCINQSVSGQGSAAEEAARKLADPNASIGSFAIPIDYITFGGDLPGASDQRAVRLSFQPSLPYVLKPGRNIFFRPLIPIIISQPTINDNGMFVNERVELGDIGFDVAYGMSFPNKIVSIFGIAGSAPTATKDDLGTGRWMLGPEAFIGKAANWGFLGILLTHTWSLNKNSTGSQALGIDDLIFIGDTYYTKSNNVLRVTAGQYMYTVNLKNAWQIQAQPVYSYNHSAEKGSRFSFPIGTGVSKTVMAGKMPLKLNLQYWYYLERPDAFGSTNQIRFQIAPVIPLPW